MKPVLDPMCGSKMFYFDKNDQRVLFGDNRNEKHTLCDGRKLIVSPDLEMDVRDLPFKDELFNLVVLDPPHLRIVGKESWMAKKYGFLADTWQEDLKKGFSECFRVLKPFGTLIFKWNEHDIKVNEILKLTEYKPIFGHKIPKRNGDTHWLVFMKEREKL